MGYSLKVGICMKVISFFIENRIFILDVITAIGTISAAGVALWLGLKQEHRRIDSTFVWGIPTNYQPTLMIHNIGIRTVVLDNIKIYYRNELVGQIDFFKDYAFRHFAVLEAGKIENFTIANEYIQIKKPEDSGKRHVLKIIVNQRNGRAYSSKQKYSYEELEELLFGQRLFEE